MHSMHDNLIHRDNVTGHTPRTVSTEELTEAEQLNIISHISVGEILSHHDNSNSVPIGCGPPSYATNTHIVSYTTYSRSGEVMLVVQYRRQGLRLPMNCTRPVGSRLSHTL